MVSADRVSIKTVKHGAPGSGAGHDKESQSLGGWIRIAAMQGQTELSSVILPSRPIISTNVANRSLCNYGHTALNIALTKIY